MTEELMLAVDLMHIVADEQDDAQDHDEYHAAGAVMSLLSGAVLTEKESDYIFRWLNGLADRIKE